MISVSENVLGESEWWISELSKVEQGPSWSWSWIYNYLCNHCLSPLKLWIRTRPWRGVFDTTFCDKVCEWLATGQWFTPGTLLAATV